MEEPRTQSSAVSGHLVGCQQPCVSLGATGIPAFPYCAEVQAPSHGEEVNEGGYTVGNCAKYLKMYCPKAEIRGCQKEQLSFPCDIPCWINESHHDQDSVGFC